MIPMKQYRFALIGCGRISKNHIAAAAANRDIMELAAVCDLKPERAEKKAEDCLQATGKKPAVYTDYHKMLKEIPADCVAIATESGYHARIALD